MTTRRKRRTILKVFLLLTTAPVCIPGWRVYRQLRQEWIDSALIPAVKEKEMIADANRQAVAMVQAGHHPPQPET
jgi:hypothetical protein